MLQGLYLHSILSDVLGDGIFAVDGAKWLHQRKALSSEFSSKMLRDFSSAVFKLGAVKLARVIATCDQAIDIQVSLHCLLITYHFSCHCFENDTNIVVFS